MKPSDLHIRVGLAKGDSLAPVKPSILSIDPAGSVIEVGERRDPAQDTSKPSPLPANAGKHLQNKDGQNHQESPIVGSNERFCRNAD